MEVIGHVFSGPDGFANVGRLLPISRTPTLRSIAKSAFGRKLYISRGEDPEALLKVLAWQLSPLQVIIDSVFLTSPLKRSWARAFEHIGRMAVRLEILDRELPMEAMQILMVDQRPQLRHLVAPMPYGDTWAPTGEFSFPPTSALLSLSLQRCAYDFTPGLPLALTDLHLLNVSSIQPVSPHAFVDLIGSLHSLRSLIIDALSLDSDSQSVAPPTFQVDVTHLEFLHINQCAHDLTQALLRHLASPSIRSLVVHQGWHDSASLCRSASPLIETVMGRLNGARTCELHLGDTIAFSAHAPGALLAFDFCQAGHSATAVQRALRLDEHLHGHGLTYVLFSDVHTAKNLFAAGTPKACHGAVISSSSWAFASEASLDELCVRLYDLPIDTLGLPLCGHSFVSSTAAYILQSKIARLPLRLDMSADVLRLEYSVQNAAAHRASRQGFGAGRTVTIWAHGVSWCQQGLEDQIGHLVPSAAIRTGPGGIGSIRTTNSGPVPAWCVGLLGGKQLVDTEVTYAWQSHRTFQLEDYMSRAVDGAVLITWT